MNIESLIRKNIRALVPYSSARDEFNNKAEIFLDANESPFPSPYNRYPDPLQERLKKKIGALNGIATDSIFLGNGSDEAIDLLIRAFCEPGAESILITEPTYGMYRVCANVNNVGVKSIPLDDAFDLDLQEVKNAIDPSVKIIFLCCPNNPTGNSLSKEKIMTLIKTFNGLVVIDEAYIDFSTKQSFHSEITRAPNLVVLQTFSKAWGMAGLRVGMCFANSTVINCLNKIKYPYNLSVVAQQIMIDQLSGVTNKDQQVFEIIKERKRLNTELASMRSVLNVYPSDANFLLVKFNNARDTYLQLIKNGIVVRDRSSVPGCENCLRITIGTVEENNQLLNVLKAL